MAASSRKRAEKGGRERVEIFTFLDLGLLHLVVEALLQLLLVLLGQGVEVNLLLLAAKWVHGAKV